MGGPELAPQAPQRSSRPGGAGPLLELREAHRRATSLAMRRLLFGVGLAVAVAGCASTEAPAPPSADRAAGAAGRVPIGRFFANDQSNWHYRGSPDGSRLAWVASPPSPATVFLRTLPAGGGGDLATGPPR